MSLAERVVASIGWLVALWAVAMAGGALFGKLRQPRVAGEIAGGLLLGPTVLGRLSPAAASIAAAAEPAVGIASTTGLFLLMFASGSGMKGLLTGDDRRAVSWLALVGTAVPFVLTIGISPFLPLDHVMGPANQRVSLVLVLAIAAAVTSIPVISRIFHDLGVIDSRFARLVLAVAVAEDIVLWVVLAVATSLARSVDLEVFEVGLHTLATVGYCVAALTLGPRAFRLERFEKSPPPVAWVGLVVAFYVALGQALGVSLVFTAFFAGLGVTTGRGPRSVAIERLNAIAFVTVVPVYFAAVGARLDLARTFEPLLFLAILGGACAVKLVAVAVGARLAGFHGLDIVNLAVATNARGGPGIVLATVALAEGIVNAPCATALVALAVVTSQIAGTWLELVLKRGWPLLRESGQARA